MLAGHGGVGLQCAEIHHHNGTVLLVALGLQLLRQFATTVPRSPQFPHSNTRRGCVNHHLYPSPESGARMQRTRLVHGVG